jgi:hypothetical protein
VHGNGHSVFQPVKTLCLDHAASGEPRRPPRAGKPPALRLPPSAPQRAYKGTHSNPEMCPRVAPPLHHRRRGGHRGRRVLKPVCPPIASPRAAATAGRLDVWQPDQCISYDSLAFDPGNDQQAPTTRSTTAPSTRPSPHRCSAGRGDPGRAAGAGPYRSGGAGGCAMCPRETRVDDQQRDTESLPSRAPAGRAGGIPPVGCSGCPDARTGTSASDSSARSDPCGGMHGCPSPSRSVPTPAPSGPPIDS